jgi:2-iminobutanoate/2-iminopropanoate deaminase
MVEAEFCLPHGVRAYLTMVHRVAGNACRGQPLKRRRKNPMELVPAQMKLCVETAGSSLENVLKCNAYCTSVEKFAIVNSIYSRYFPKDPPARTFVCVPAWPGPFDIEFDRVATL